MTRKSIIRMSGMSSKKICKVATVGFIVSCCNLFWMFFKWMFIASWYLLKWGCIGTAKLCKWTYIGTVKLCKWSFKGVAKFTKWVCKTGKKIVLKIKERRFTTSEM